MAWILQGTRRGEWRSGCRTARRSLSLERSASTGERRDFCETYRERQCARRLPASGAIALVGSRGAERPYTCLRDPRQPALAAFERAGCASRVAEKYSHSRRSMFNGSRSWRNGRAAGECSSMSSSLDSGVRPGRKSAWRWSRCIDATRSAVHRTRILALCLAAACVYRKSGSAVPVQPVLASRLSPLVAAACARQVSDTGQRSPATRESSRLMRNADTHVPADAPRKFHSQLMVIDLQTRQVAGNAQSSLAEMNGLSPASLRLGDATASLAQAGSRRSATLLSSYRDAI